MLTFKTPV